MSLPVRSGLGRGGGGQEEVDAVAADEEVHDVRRREQSIHWPEHLLGENFSPVLQKQWSLQSRRVEDQQHLGCLL